MIGHAIGPYEILSKLGQGGMGEVYRATDTTLKRQVAIKVLPEAVATDPQRLARFQREAEVLAALNHPNIAQIYGLQKADGHVALVMELVEGPTLDELIRSGQPEATSVSERLRDSDSAAERRGWGPAATERSRQGLSVDDTLHIARQITDALDAAHEQGIVHRDLKPANIKVRDDGTVKVLDFGLAKAVAAEPPGGQRDLVNSPTITTPAMTEMGMILGTAAYMSPEQARGKPVDKRADIWAFGCVLYEMLTGRRAFEGEDVSLTLSKVLQLEPDFEALPPGVPPRVRRVLEACLRKDPRQRVRDIGDLRLALEGAFETESHRDAEMADIAPSGSRRPVLAAAAALVAGVVGTGLVGWGLWPAAEVRPVVRFVHGVPEGRNFAPFTRAIVDLSRDGSQFVYATDAGLFLRTMDGLEARAITDAIQAVNPFFSPDGRSVGYWELAQLKRIDLAGGAPVVICAMTNPPRGVSWETDGTILVADGRGILRVPATGGEPEVLIAAGAGDRMDSPRLLPGGNRVLFTLLSSGANTATDWSEAQVVVQSLKTGERTVILSGARDARYVPTGHLVYGVGDGLFAVRFDVERLATTGSPVSIVAGVAGVSAISGAAVFYAVSESGTLLYVPTGTDVLRTPVWADRSGRSVEPISTIPAGSYDMPRLSPDGTRVMLWSSGDAWIYELASGRSRAVTRDGLGGVYGAWSPDGSRVAFSSARDGDFNVWVTAADGSGQPERVTNLEGTVHVDSWSPDGQTLAVHQHVRGETNILMVPIDDGAREPVEFLVRPPVDEEDALFSPDGRYVAYESVETGRREIYVRPFQGPGGAEPVSVGGGREPVWAANGDLFYRTETGDRVMVVSVQTSPTLDIGIPREVSSEPFYFDLSGSPRAQYDVTADGQRLLLLKTPRATADDRPRIVVIQNWTEELQRRVPVD